MAGGEAGVEARGRSESERGAAEGSSPEQAVALLGEAKGAERMGRAWKAWKWAGCELTDARLEKHGDALRAEGVMSEEDIRRALPEGVRSGAREERRRDGARCARAGACSGWARAWKRWRQAEDGKLVVRPTGLLLSALKLTLFEDASVYVEGVEARALASEPGEGARYELSMWASLR